jgi:hypothetical protein
MRMRKSVVTAVVLLVLCAMETPVAYGEPEYLERGPWANVIRLPDGRLMRTRATSGLVLGSFSIDNGTTWTAQTTLFNAPGSSNPMPILDQHGELHIVRFILRDETDGAPRQNGVNYFLDLWHNQSHSGMTAWTTPQLVFPGYVGSVMRGIETRSGRLVVPFGNWGQQSGFGNFYTTAMYSDDNGGSWQVSPSQLRTPVPSDWNGASDGAVEPTIIQLNDDRLWLLMRSQTGRLTESFSSDNGTTWSSPRNSSFHTTTGPPNMVRMDDGRLVLIWNNGTMPQRHNGQIWYAGRDALHAAISDDDGRTWKGFREIYLDPFRNDNPIGGDTGTAYPFPTLTNDGRIFVLTGQGNARTNIRFDPDWLLESSRATDFTEPDALDDWSVFKSYGQVVSVKRAREQGPVIIDDPDPLRTKPVLHIRRPDEKDPDAAVWNFPMAKKGETRVRLQLQAGFAGGSIALSDRFIEPGDSQGDTAAIFRLAIGGNRMLPNGTILLPGVWYDLDLKWDLARHEATVEIDGLQVAVLEQRHQALPGASYLRLRSTATTVDPLGYLIDAVSQQGFETGPVRESIRLSAGDANAKLQGAAPWTLVRFDDYVPNNNVTESNSSGNGEVMSCSGIFTGFISPTTTAKPFGLIVTSSTGTITFTDATSLQVTSDLLGPKNGETLTFTFVDPNDISIPAIVSQVAWRFGSTLAENVFVTLYDIHGNIMPDYLSEALAASGAGTSVGFDGIEDLYYAPSIHRIVFTGVNDDTWLIGSFAQDSMLFDFGFTGFMVVPEPAAGSLLAVVLVALRRRRRLAFTPERASPSTVPSE